MNLVGRILAPLAFMGVLAATDVAAQDVSISAGVGGFSGSEKAMQDIYGPMWKFRATVDVELSKSFRLEGGISYMHKEGKPYTVGSVSNAKSDITFVQGEALAILAIKGPLGIGRLGAGAVYTSISENLSGNFAGASASISGSVSGPGLIGLAGLETPLNDKLSLYGDFSVTYIPFTTATSKDTVNLGGVNVDLGLRYKL
jgi:hypothetical protein